MTIGCAASSSTFFYAGSTDEYTLIFGCADNVGFFSN